MIVNVFAEINVLHSIAGNILRDDKRNNYIGKEVIMFSINERNAILSYKLERRRQYCLKASKYIAKGKRYAKLRRHHKPVSREQAQSLPLK